MAGQLRANLRLALRTIRHSKWRSLLTLLGVVIGVAAFITVVAIGEGVKAQISGQISQLGKNLITIQAGQTGSGSGPLGLGMTAQAAGNLNPSDVAVVANTDNVEAAAPMSLVAAKPKTDGRSFDLPVLATSSQLADVISEPLAAGSFFDSDSSVNSAVVGSDAAMELFNDSQPLGDSFSLLGQRFVVTGVFDQFDSSPLSLSTNFNDVIFVRYATVSQLTRGHAPIFEILVRPSPATSETKLVGDLNRRLAAAHGQHDFSVLTQAQSLSTTSRILDLITKMIIGVAAVALLVGGVGIMDVMLVSVSERTSEIGLRKAVGASERQILDQFVIEALALSAIGAIIGTLLALIVSYLIFLFSNLTPVITWQAVVIADTVALAVGVVFGTIPAFKAAKKNPIDALRHE